MTSSRVRWFTTLAAAALISSACSGTPPQQSSDGVVVEDSQQGAGTAAPGDPGTDADGTSADAGGATPTDPDDGDGGSGGTAPPAGGQVGAGGDQGSSTTDGDSSGGDTGTDTESGSGDGGTTGGTGSGTGGGTSGSTGSGDYAYTPANLYSGEANTTGLTDDAITLCGHAALIFADAFDVREEDLNVYWQALNDQGGVHGRKVFITYEDDSYNPDQAVAAAGRCQAKDPFFLVGGIGFDQIPAVRNWAEQNQMLYLHHMAVEAGLADKRFSFSGFPSVDDVGVAFGEHIASNHGDKKIGIVWRQSENWEPGHRGGKAEMERRGVDIVADLPVSSGQSVYAQQIQALRAAGAEVVWVWENALGAAEIIQQSKSQSYNPTWVVFPFQVTLDITGSVSIEGVSAWPAYARGGYEGNFGFSQFGYAQEIERFEAAMAAYRPNVKPNDILWQVWIANKATHDLLQRCGRDCNRNKFAGIFLSGFKGTVAPNCEVDFSRPDSFGGHLGGHQFYVLEGADHPDRFSFRTRRWCSEHLG